MFNTAKNAYDKEIIGKTIPEDFIEDILRFKRATHLAKVNEDIKDGSKIILSEIAEQSCLPKKRSNPKHYGKSYLLSSVDM